MEETLIKRQLVMYENQFDIMTESQSKLKAFRHDVKNHFVVIDNYAKNGEDARIRSYIEESLGYIEVQREYVKSGNQDVDCILNYLLDKANRIGVAIEVNIKVSQERFISGIDLNIILSNLIENAVEALKDVEQKQLSVIMNQEKGMLYISVYNTYQNLIVHQGELMSKKRNGNKKGIGIENVKKIVEKYSGKFDISYDDHIFKADSIIFLQENM